MDFDGTHLRLFGEPVFVYLVINLVRRLSGFFSMWLVLAVGAVVALVEWGYYAGGLSFGLEQIVWFVETTLLIAFAAIGLNEALTNGRRRDGAWHASWFRRQPGLDARTAA